MQPADLRNDDDLIALQWLKGTRVRAVLIEWQTRSGSMVISIYGDSTWRKWRSLKDDDAVQATAPDRADHVPERGEPGVAEILATQHCQLVLERNDLELQFRATAKPTREPREKPRDKCTHPRETKAGRDKPPDFSALSKLSVETTDKS